MQTKKISAKTADQQYFPGVSIIIVLFNSKQHIKKCLDSVMAQDYPKFEVLVIDNNSSDNGAAFVEEHYPDVKVIRSQENLGYSGGNNLGFAHASHELIAVLNPDTRVASNWLKELVTALHLSDSIGLVTPKTLMEENAQIVNTCGNEISIFGLTFCRGLSEPAEKFQVLEPVSAISGVCFVTKKSVLETIGEFHETYFLYYEDTDLSLRCLLAGFEILYVPDAVIFHDYHFKYSGLKAFHQEKNRYFTFLSIFKWPTLVVLLPGLLFSEVISWVYAMLRGKESLRGKAASYRWIWQNRTAIKEVRARNSNIRQVKDSKLIRRMGCRIRFGGTIPQLGAQILEYLSAPFTCLYGLLVKAIVFW